MHNRVIESIGSSLVHFVYSGVTRFESVLQGVVEVVQAQRDY